MRVHFWNWNVRDTVVILEEGNLPHSRCPLCDMLVPWRTLNGMHRRTVQCKRGAESKQRSLAAEEEREVIVRELSAYGFPLEMVNSFQYLERVIFPEEDDCPAVVRNLSREREVWKRMTRILKRDEGEPRVSGFFLKAVVQAVLLFGLETWVATPRTGKSLGEFRDQMARRLTGRLPRRKHDRMLTYTSAAMTRETVGFQTTK